MKKLFILTLILISMLIISGCSYEVISKNTQKLQGESENWIAEYEVEFITNYPEKDWKICGKSEENETIIVTYKKDISKIADTKHIEIEYNDSFGSGGKRTEDYESPLTKKQFRLGGGTGSTKSEFNLLEKSDLDLSTYLKIYSGPGKDERESAKVTVKVNLDGKVETIQLESISESNTKPVLNLAEKLNEWLAKKQMESLFKELESYPALDPQQAINKY